MLISYAVGLCVRQYKWKQLTSVVIKSCGGGGGSKTGVQREGGEVTAM
jgi:hypothetical protein